jgi:hypothetical protein
MLGEWDNRNWKDIKKKDVVELSLTSSLMFIDFSSFSIFFFILAFHFTLFVFLIDFFILVPFDEIYKEYL